MAQERNVARTWLLPAGFYLVCFCALTYPLITLFSTHYFTDEGDGLQNVWNLWWVNKAVTQLHQLPWYTTYLHYPHGVSLLGHTLNPFNGFAAIPLLRVLSLTQTHNALIVFSFVSGGMTAFWLCRALNIAWWPSLAGGFIFTFCNFHFAHAQGHMQLVSLEWIPLFVLCIYRLFDEPRPARALGAAAVLFLVILCDYYYFFYCVITGVILFVWFAIQKRNPTYFLNQRYLLRLGIFTAGVLATAGPLTWGLWRLSQTDPLSGNHDPVEFSLDAWALFIPGGHWRWSALTRSYWSALPGNIHESSVYLGLSALALMLYAAVKRPGLGIWWVIAGVFGILALGPVLHVSGRVISADKLPYAYLAQLFPPLQLSGCPVRMVVMVALCAGIICAAALEVLLGGSRLQRAAAAVLLIALVVEYLPAPIPSTRLTPAKYVEQLRDAPPGGAMDLRSHPAQMLYYQTIHEKPLAFGYIARVPRSVRLKDNGIAYLVALGQLRALCERYRIRYIIDPGVGDFHDGGAACAAY